MGKGQRRWDVKGGDKNMMVVLIVTSSCRAGHGPTKCKLRLTVLQRYYTKVS